MKRGEMMVQTIENYERIKNEVIGMLDDVSNIVFDLGTAYGLAETFPEKVLNDIVKRFVMYYCKSFADRLIKYEHMLTKKSEQYCFIGIDFNKISEKFLKRIEDCMVSGEDIKDCIRLHVEDWFEYTIDIYIEAVYLFLNWTKFTRFVEHKYGRKMTVEEYKSVAEVFDMIKDLRTMLYDYFYLCYYAGKVYGEYSCGHISGFLYFGLSYEIGSSIDALLYKMRNFVRNYPVKSRLPEIKINRLDAEIKKSFKDIVESIERNIDAITIRTMLSIICDKVSKILKVIMDIVFEKTMSEQWRTDWIIRQE